MARVDYADCAGSVGATGIVVMVGTVEEMSMAAIRLKGFEDAPNSLSLQGLIRFITQTCGKQLAEVSDWWLACGPTSGRFHLQFTDETGRDGRIIRMADDTWEIL